MKLSKKISKRAVSMELRSTNKEEALGELVDLLCGAYRIGERETCLEAIRKREEKQSTGIGMGLAVPHAKTTAVDRLYIAFGRSTGGIEFESLDKEKAHIFFILLSPRDVSGPHIRALAGISRLVKHEEFRHALLECNNAASFFDLVEKAEEKYL